jgi:hypothetical protein
VGIVIYMKLFVIEKGKKINKNNILFMIIGTLMIWSAIVPLIIIDIYATIYQKVYFTIQGIPKIKRSKYLNLDRWNLSKLSIGQKISCIYCSYANGIAAWFKAIVNQTETYSCAIKHQYKTPGQEHQSNYAEYKKYL